MNKIRMDSLLLFVQILLQFLLREKMVEPDQGLPPRDGLQCPSAPAAG